MKRYFSILLLATLVLATHAQGGWSQPFGQQGQQGQPERFSPEKFEAQLEEFITNEAKLTGTEASKFFPVYKEMQQKQRELFIRQRELEKEKPCDEQGCLKVIREGDDIELELKRIQKIYHKRFLDMLPASKVYDILKAEQRFHRRMMKNWGRGSGSNQRPQGFQWPHQQQFMQFPQLPK